MKLVWIAQRLGRQGQRRKVARIASSLFFIVALTALCLYILLAYFLANDPRLVPVAFQTARSILLVTAHPDDETLFFSPSITYRRDDPHVQRALLVISSGGLDIHSYRLMLTCLGNYEGIGERRQQEIHDSCSVLGIVPDRCVVLDDAALQDNPRKWWNEELIKDLVASHVQKWNADLVCCMLFPALHSTLDTDFRDHHLRRWRRLGAYQSQSRQRWRSVRSPSSSIPNAAEPSRTYITSTPNAPPAYTLQSTFLIHKYSSLLDLIPTAIPFSWRILKAILTSPASSPADGVHDLSPPEAYNDKVLLVSPWRTYLVSRAAFAQHASQYSWDRSFYLVLSRYMWCNNLNKLVV